MRNNWLVNIGFLVVWLGFCRQSAAFPLLFGDARSAAMGSTGVATDPRNAVMWNPSLSATSYEEYGWYAVLPAYHKVTADPDNLETALNDFLAAANDYFNSGSAVDQEKTRKALAAMEGKSYRERNAKLLLLGVPSEVLSGAFYFSKYQVFTARPTIGAPQFEQDKVDYHSTIDYRGIDVSEMGFSGGLPFNTRSMGDIKLGATLKFQLIDGLGYSESVASSSLSLNDQDTADRASIFNIDLGFSKEVGVWKFGMAAQNLVSKSVNLGDSGESYSFEPLVHGGIAYRSRRTYLEMDADLTQTQQLGIKDKSRFAKLGWEYNLLSWLYLRAGAQHDFGGNNLSTLSYGVGIDIGGYEIDAAAISSEEEKGFYAQLTLKM